MEGFVIALVLIAGLFLIYGYILNYFPKVEEYSISSGKIHKDTTLVLLTDLHGCEHGRNNKRLLEKICENHPDFLCIAGDMTVKNGKHTTEVLSFLEKISKKYPVYYAPGNHEIRMPEYESYKEEIRRMGIQYLENESVLAANGICITGLDLPEYWYHKCWQKRELTKERLNELIGVCRKNECNILLAHNPEYFPQYTKWGADLTLSGHVHGGIARLPVLGGVIAPSLRLFPAYDAGEFEKNGHHMIISRGLGLHHIKLRFFNRPEISVIKLSCHLREKQVK